jgi:hypothetical protein
MRYSNVDVGSDPVNRGIRNVNRVSSQSSRSSPSSNGINLPRLGADPLDEERMPRCSLLIFDLDGVLCTNHRARRCAYLGDQVAPLSASLPRRTDLSW